MENLREPRALLALAWAERFTENYPPALSAALRAYRLSPRSGAVHDELRRIYAALGRREGYDEEVALREIYHLEKTIEAGRIDFENDAEARAEARRLISIENRLQEASHHAWGVRVLAPGTDPASVPLWRIEVLPDDGVSRTEQFKALDRLMDRMSKQP